MKQFLPVFIRHKTMISGTMILAGTQIVSSLCGFVRDRAFATVFPFESDPIGVASVYIAAFRPSDLLFQMFVMSCISVVLVPFLASHLANNQQKEMNRVLTNTMLVFGGIFGIIALMVGIFFRDLAPLFVQFQGKSLELYITFGRLALFTNVLFVFGNTLGQYLITKERYWVYGITPIVWAMGTIAGIYLLTPVFGFYGPIIGTVIGTMLYVLIRLIGTIRAGYIFMFLPKQNEYIELIHMGKLILPRMVALGALQLQLLILDRYASGLGTQMGAINQFASNFESVIPGIVGISIAQAAFSKMSQAVATKNFASLRKTVVATVLTNLFIAVPGAIVLYFCLPIAGAILHLQKTSSPLFTSSLLIYCFAIPFESTNHILLRGFYALKNTLWPAISSVISCGIAIATCIYFLGNFGIFALALAYVSAQISQTVLLSSALGVRLLYKKGARTDKLISWLK